MNRKYRSPKTTWETKDLQIRETCSKNSRWWRDRHGSYPRSCLLLDPSEPSSGVPSWISSLTVPVWVAPVITEDSPILRRLCSTRVSLERFSNYFLVNVHMNSSTCLRSLCPSYRVTGSCPLYGSDFPSSPPTSVPKYSGTRYFSQVDIFDTDVNPDLPWVGHVVDRGFVLPSSPCLWG